MQMRVKPNSNNTDKWVSTVRTFLTQATKIGSGIGIAIGAWLCAAASCDRFHTRQQVESARARVNNAHKLDGWAYCCAIFIPQLPTTTTMSATGICCCLSQTYSHRWLRSLFDSQSPSQSQSLSQLPSLSASVSTFGSFCGRCLSKSRPTSGICVCLVWKNDAIYFL